MRTTPESDFALGDHAFLQGGGAMAREIRAFDWGSTPLGRIETWSAALKITVSTLLNSAFPKCLCWGDGLTMIYNDAFIPILDAKHPCLGRPFLEVWSDVAEEIRPIALRALAGDSTFIEDFALTTNRSGTFEQANFTFCYSPIRDEHGVVRGMLDTVVETTGKVRAEALAELRNRELVHRSRNAYALVSALVNHSFRSAQALPEIKDMLQLRIEALVRAQDLLMETETGSVSLDVVSRRALGPFLDDSDRVEIRGPEVFIGREQVTTLCLALHELGTNSMKYGALGLPSGRVLLGWQIDSLSQPAVFRLEWRESGGPPVTQPAAQGFGSTLIAHSLPMAFRGTVELDYAPAGFRLTLAADAARLLDEHQDARD
ncbi:sensor histidine kinase (plasmid) [Paroceanicella profunda]|uniref:histidine kinase n=1 Tax=Paroceanicella profunda TaxID=2579971 RepID=A0A5B8FJM8_9RHOB|nr:HWE histidine kinase domain-containing protein [Paroceanicella profunda]QDL94617.1 sensor histidine kinase [Paroceanicella profunda]